MYGGWDLVLLPDARQLAHLEGAAARNLNAKRDVGWPSLAAIIQERVYWKVKWEN